MQAKNFKILVIEDVRKVAYLLAEQMNLKHRVNKETERAGYDLMKLFLSRHADIEITKSEGVSFSPSTALNKPEQDGNCLIGRPRYVGTKSHLQYGRDRTVIE